jgi:hypothetical protein
MQRCNSSTHTVGSTEGDNHASRSRKFRNLRQVGWAKLRLRQLGRLLLLLQTLVRVTRPRGPPPAALRRLHLRNNMVNRYRRRMVTAGRPVAQLCRINRSRLRLGRAHKVLSVLLTLNSVRSLRGNVRSLGNAIRKVRASGRRWASKGIRNSSCVRFPD